MPISTWWHAQTNRKCAQPIQVRNQLLSYVNETLVVASCHHFASTRGLWPLRSVLYRLVFQLFSRILSKSKTTV